MQKILLGAVSAAALMMAGAASAAEEGTWTGLYIGITAGMADRSEGGGETILFDTNLDGQYGDTVRTAAGADAFSPGFCGGPFNTNAAPGGCRSDDDTDAEIGVRIGYDYQLLGNWVLGGVFEYSQLELNDAVTAFSTTPAAYSFNRKLTSTFALRARGGYAYENFLFYVTGGYAQGNVRHSFSTTNTVNSFPLSGGGDAKGYQIGAGGEYKILENVSIGAEFLHTNLDDDDFGTRAINNGTTAPTNPFLLVNTGGTGFLRSWGHIKYNAFRETLNYRF
jgi:opacity protein-like surface antigen